MKNIKHLIKKLIGSTDDNSFEEMLYHGICLFGFIGVSALAVLTLTFQIPIKLMLLAFFMLSFFSVMYYWGRFKKHYSIPALYLFSVFSAVIAFFFNGGLRGAPPYTLLILLILALAYSPIKWHVYIFIFHLIVICTVFLIGYRYPWLVAYPYKVPGIPYGALVIANIFSSFLGFMGIYYLRKRYDHEREKNRLQQVRLEKTNEQKSMFFINLSHEIKTPLTLVENFLEKYIERKGEDEELLVMRQNILKMRRDIVEYLNFENLERGKISYEQTQVLLLSKFLEEKIRLFVPYAGNKGIMLHNNIEPGILAQVNVQGIDQILNNLLENAVKYTPEQGEINVSLKKEITGIKLTIQNSGTEIAANQVSHLFEPFYQLSNEKQNIQGMGMGLYIVKKILEHMGGDIQVNSSKEIGVVFSVIFPLGQEYDPVTLSSPGSFRPITGAIMRKAKDSAYSVQKACLLVVEDHNDLLSYLVGELCENYNVFIADNGLTAIGRLENIPVPELIISDIMMDKMDGYELLAHTLADEKFAHVPFIFLTAKDTPGEKISGLNRGALDFITKPFSIEELKIKIKTIIEQKKRISKAAIRDTKKQFNDEHHVNTKQKSLDIFNTNILYYRLSSREKEIILYLKEGLAYEKIAEKLHISRHTVNRHVQNIYEKTGVNSKAGLIDKLFFSLYNSK
jgi:two-component system, sensor histidine kinase ChiS